MDASFSIQIAIVKSAICYRAVKADYCFDILRNESASIEKLSEHPRSAPHLVSVLGYHKSREEVKTNQGREVKTNQGRRVKN